MTYRVVIADRAYSSWSMRGWLLLAGFGLPFEEELVRLGSPGFEAMRAARAPCRTVPILEWEEGGQLVRVSDSLAIAETLAERHPEAGHWPEETRARAIARSLAAEMHAGFQTLRTACPMNLHRSGRGLASPPAALGADLERLASLWSWALDATGGPWLGGARFSAADVFFAPVATRLESYALTTPSTEPYAARVLGHDAVRSWVAAARAESYRIPACDEIG